MPEAVIVDAIRTPIGRAGKGSLVNVRADDLAAVPLQALVERNPGVDFSETIDVMMGCAMGMGEAGYNVGRNAALLAGLDHHIPATTVNRFCASSLQTIRMAFHAIKVGEGDQYIAAGVEAVSRFPQQAPFDPHPQLDGSDGAPYNVYIPMGLTAENVAKRCQVSRAAQDEWAKLSQDRAVAARDGGHFDAEIVPWATSPATTARARARRWRSWPSSSRCSIPRTAPSPRATRAHSTTARRRCWCSLRRRRRPSASRRGPHRGLLRGGHPARDHGPGPDPCGAGGARAGRHDDRGHGRRGAQRGVRRAGRALPGRAWASTRRSSTRSAARSPSATPSA